MRTGKLWSLALALLLAVASFAHASVINWSLQNVSFSDGTSITGSFVYNTTAANPLGGTGEVTSVTITTSGGSTVPATSGWVVSPTLLAAEIDYHQGFIAVDSTAADLTGAHVVSLFDSTGNLANPGTLTLDFALIGTCFDAACDSASPFSTGSGNFVPAVIPEPGSMVLLGGGLMSLGALARRRLRR